jgi:ATP phosphoribosyltransferase
VKPADVPTYVEYGAADIGIAGRDVLLETRADVLSRWISISATASLPWRVPKGRRPVNGSGQPTIRIATKYPYITLDFYNSRGIPVEIIPLSGSIELAPLIGLADRIVDLVETGRTLKKTGLEI